MMGAGVNQIEVDTNASFTFIVGHKLQEDCE